MRPSCLNCARKHVAQAEVLLTEYHQGYALHLWLAVGHLAEAEAELIERWPEHADYIRQHRILLIAEPTYKVPTLKILEVLCSEAQTMQSNGVSKADYSPEGVLQGPLDDVGSEPQGEVDASLPSE